MVEKESSFRTTISVPSDLKRRMDAATEQVNWSAVAGQAFEAKLAEIASRKEKKTMEDVIQRLRASKQIENNKEYKLGEKAGNKWAESQATAKELNELNFFREDCLRRKNWGATPPASMFGKSRSASSAAQWIYFQIHAENHGDEASARSFWEKALGENELLKRDSAFVWGFCDAALAVWQAVREHI